MLINTNAPKCPTCGGELVSISHYDACVMENNILAVSVVGGCDHCGNQYEWVEYYTYAGYASVQPTKIKARSAD